MNIKDNFSAIAADYAAWRPDYPEYLFSYLASLSKLHERALDCGTGNGQAAKMLAQYFGRVYATDISAAQLEHRSVSPNIHYSIAAAEKTGFPDNHFDMICAAQAAHWFDHSAFYPEAERIIKPGGILALVGYGAIDAGAEINSYISVLYKDILGAYWDDERKFIDDHYRSLPFPYSMIHVPGFEINCEWDLKQLVGYLGTWSALDHYKKKHNNDPLQELLPALYKLWGDEALTRPIRFPGFSKVAVIK